MEAAKEKVAIKLICLRKTGRNFSFNEEKNLTKVWSTCNEFVLHTSVVGRPVCDCRLMRLVQCSECVRWMTRNKLFIKGIPARPTAYANTQSHTRWTFRVFVIQTIRPTTAATAEAADPQKSNCEHWSEQQVVCVYVQQVPSGYVSFVVVTAYVLCLLTFFSFFASKNCLQLVRRCWQTRR